MGGPRASSDFRPDIEGLRGVAVLLVVLYHAGVTFLPGGFVGVDVFFVISGFLITGLLVRERERTGTVSLRAFYARRVRRLLPAATVVLLATLAAIALVLPPVDRPAAALDGAASALSVANLRFASLEGDYFAPATAPSPFLHFWSLSVEEQFYLLWPALVILAAAGAGRVRRRTGIALLVVGIASFAANLAITDAAVTWAFYSLPTRAWQLALGGLLAIGSLRLERIPAGFRRLVGWLGLAAIVESALLLDGSLAYPGAWALLPTIGSAAVIAAGADGLGPVLLLGRRPLRFLGLISYSLYLWHWPILRLPATVAEPDLPLETGLALALLAVGVAWCSWRFIEEPFRRGLPVLAGRPGRTILAGSAAIALVVSLAAGSGALAALAPGGPTDDPGATGQVEPTPSDALPTDEPTAEPSPTDATSGEETGGTEETPGPTAIPTAGPATLDGVKPSLARARYDEERLRGDGCLAFERVTVPPTCVYGVSATDFTLALVGDSHAAQWFPAVERAAKSRGWRIVTYVKVSCPFLDIRVTNVALKREYTECPAFWDATFERLTADPPDLTLVAMSRLAIHPVRSADRDLAVQSASLARMMERLPGGPAALIVDTPSGTRDIPSCLSSHPTEIELCAIPQRDAFRDDLGALERGSGWPVIDMTAWICRGDPCPVVVERMIVFRDRDHLTATFSRSLGPELRDGIEALLAR